MYRCECWTIKKAEHQRIDAFEMWCWLRLMKITGWKRFKTVDIVSANVLWSRGASIFVKRKQESWYQSLCFIYQTHACYISLPKFWTLLNNNLTHVRIPLSFVCKKPFQCTLISAAAAKLLQLCLTLCDPIDSSSPGSPVPGTLQARTLVWVAISFSNAWKWKVKGKSLRWTYLQFYREKAHT